MKFLTIILLLPVMAAADDQALDFWVEEVRLLASASAGQHVDAGLKERRHVNYQSKEVTWNIADKRAGDMSLVYTPQEPDKRPVFGFVASLWGQTWDLTSMDSLAFWLKVENGKADAAWDVRLVDVNGNQAKGELKGIPGDWKEMKIPFSALAEGNGFDWTQVAMLEFEETLAKDARVWFDGVQFAGKANVLGITDKPLSQRMAEAKATKNTRVMAGFEDYVRDFENGKYKGGRPNGGGHELTAVFAKMMLDQDLEWANEALVRVMRTENGRDTWSLWKTPMYARMYLMFSSKGRYPGRMTPETEQLMLEVLWSRTAFRNDIYWAKMDTWWMDGSENHDINEESCNIATSRIFAEEDAYKDRVFPNPGFGGGSVYGKAGYYGPGIDHLERKGGGRANMSDGKEYKAANHLAVWKEVFDHYARERAKHGFFLENNSPGYAKHTLGFMELGYMYSGDEGLEKLFLDFYDLYWANWAQVTQFGQVGGPKTRHRNNVGGQGSDKPTADLITFHLGGPANGGLFWYWNNLMDYTPHPVVWKMTLDREGMGEYAYRARGIGEEQQIWPRPKGAERTLMIDPNSRLLKSAWITPDYTLGSQMDHPAAIHSHLSIQRRWQGMTVAQSGDARIVPVAVPGELDHHGVMRKYENSAFWSTVHHEQTLIVQRARRYTAVSPVWFPAHTHIRQIPVGIYIGDAWDEKVERDGWVFLREGKAYAAVRPVMWDEAWERENQVPNEGNQIYFHRWDDPATVKLCEGCYNWKHDGAVMALDDSDTPVLIEAGRESNFGSFEAFISDVMDNPLALYKTVVPGYHILVYTGSGKHAKEIVYNSGTTDIPTIGGEHVSYSYPKTFDSPYIQSEFGSGEVTIEFGGESLHLKF